MSAYAHTKRSATKATRRPGSCAAKTLRGELCRFPAGKATPWWPASRLCALHKAEQRHRDWMRSDKISTDLPAGRRVGFGDPWP